MKKILLALVVSSLALASVFANISVDSDVKSRSMSLNGVADCSSSANFFYNPASIYLFDQKTKSITSFGFADYRFNSSDKLLSRPETYIKTEFISSRIAMAINIDINVPNDPVLKNEDYYYDLIRDVDFCFNVATGFDEFGFGLGLYGGSAMEKNGVSNVVYQTLFGDFDRLNDSQYVDLRAGMIYRFNNFSFGIVDEKLFSYTGKTNDMVMDNAVGTLSAGMYYSDNKFGKRGRLNKWVLDAGLECLNIFDEQERAIVSGAEATIQLTNEYSISFRYGVDVPTIDINKSAQSIGIGTRLGSFDIGLYTKIPLNIFSGDVDTVSINLNLTYLK